MVCLYFNPIKPKFHSVAVRVRYPCRCCNYLGRAKYTMKISSFNNFELNYLRENCNFTALEMDCFNLKAKGQTNYQIAMDLNICDSTVCVTMKSVREKITAVLEEKAKQKPKVEKVADNLNPTLSYILDILMKLLENKTALITGAARGIGRCMATMFADEGANVIFTDLKETDSSKELVEQLVAIHKELAEAKLSDVVITRCLRCVGMEHTLCISTIIF